VREVVEFSKEGFGLMNQMEQRIGEAAGTIWNALYAKESMTKSRIAKVTGLPTQLMNQGIGWLAREGKLTITKQKKTELIELKE